MKKILIISPHFPPSNLTAVHRARFFANHLKDYGWEPVILMVHENDYEEQLDYNLAKLLPADLRIEKARAMGLTKPRLIGDIGLRAFRSMYKKAKEIISLEKIDFLYITIPSFYGALWGRWLHEKTGIPYGIDYIDPWVHVFPGSEKRFSRHYMATLVSKFLEPIAVKKASLISGVAVSYYEDVIVRNPHLKATCRCIGIPFGSEEGDHAAVKRLDLKPYLFEPKPGKIQLVYAGAMLPKAYALLEEVFKSMVAHASLFENVEFHFIGSGKSPTNLVGFNIKPLAEKYGLWEKNVFEYPARIPYLDVLVHLNACTGVFILGSTEPHYTPSKVYQAVLSEKPVLAVLHKKSTAVPVIRESGAGLVLDFDGEQDVPEIGERFFEIFQEYVGFIKTFDASQINRAGFETYSAKNITGVLVRELNEIVGWVR